MPFPFSEVCTLFSRLEDIELHHPPILAAAERNARSKSVTESWFKSHRLAIDKLNPHDAVALLSTIFPEQRSDRVYSIQSTALHRILSRCIGLSAARAKDLRAYQQPGGGDLGLCLERVLSSCGPPARPPVNLEEIDNMLTALASTCRFSGPNVTTPSSTESRDLLIGNIVKRLEPIQGKWLVRLILKDLTTIQLREKIPLECFHFLLPDLLRFQNTFEAALRLLRGPLREFPPQPDPRSQRLHRESAAQLLQPVVGIKLGRPSFIKGRSIDSCVKMCGERRWILERKYDGEYCEVHIDMNRSSKPSECITLFSKSGKDSTDDRQNIHQVLIECLRLDHPERRIRQRAIILSEIVVYNDASAEILPFERVRQHARRSGIFWGTDEDSTPDRSEHLAIVFFDLLLLDDEVTLRKPLQERRRRLREVYTKMQGRAFGAEWKIVDFRDAAKAKRTIVRQFAASIAERCEGLILKPCCEPYFSLNQHCNDRVNAYIKLKKDYIAGMGDEADLAAIGGSYNGQQALKCAMQHIKWTTFHLGCLLNKSEVLRFSVRPRYKIVATINAEHCIPREVLNAANSLGALSATPYVRGSSPNEFDIESVPSDMSTVFENPLVFEVLGSGFEKPSNSSFLMLRHPRVKKLHQDRSWKDSVSFDELQAQALAARGAPLEGESRETIKLIQKLEAKCQRRVERNRTSSPGSKAVVSPSTGNRGHQSQSPCSKKDRKEGMMETSRNKSLDGTTLVDESPAGLKRRCDASSNAKEYPVVKKRRIHGSIDKSQKTVVFQNAPGPLADITNTAPHATPARPPCSHGGWIESEHENGPKGITAPLLGPSLSHRSSRSWTSCANHREEKCASSLCLFAEAVIYASSCIASTPYIMRDLIPCHNVTTAQTLAHWDRDSLAHPQGTETVSESQAYKGMRKIVLVERMRPLAVREIVAKVLNFNARQWRERVEFWDWRILETERCRLHWEIAADKNTVHFLGATEFDSAESRAVFIEIGGLSVEKERVT